MRRLALSLLLLCGCDRRPPERLEAVLDRASRDLQAGELALTQAECDHGIMLARQHNDTGFVWKFRLLRAEALLHSARTEEVLSELADPVPARSEFGALAARKKMLEGEAHYVLGH